MANMEGGSFYFEYEHGKIYELWRMMGCHWTLNFVDIEFSAKALNIPRGFSEDVKSFITIRRDFCGRILRVIGEIIFSIRGRHHPVEAAFEHIFEERECYYRLPLNNDCRAGAFDTFRGHFKVYSAKQVKNSETNASLSDIWNDMRSSLTVSSVSRDTEALLAKQVLCDVVLKCGTLTIKAHKAILGARSPVFAEMFQQEGLISDEVLIRDMEEEDCKEMIYFIYSGKIRELNFDLAWGLFIAAGKYSLQELQNICALFLASEMADDTAVLVLELADSHGHSNMKLAAVEYICEHFSPVEKTKEWNDLLERRPSLAVEVLASGIRSCNSKYQNLTR